RRPASRATGESLSRIDVGSCEFCRIIRGEADARIVCTTPETLAFFPVQPAALGHPLVVPRDHVEDIWSLQPMQVAPLALAVVRVAHAIRDALHPDGLNVIN